MVGLGGGRPARKPWLRAIALVAGAPVLGIVALMAAGRLAPLPGLALLTLTLGAAAWITRRWLITLSSLASRLRQAAFAPEEPADFAPTGLSPALDEVVASAGRLAGALRERAAQVERMRLADAAILQAVPDPLLVLSAERTPLRANAAARALLGVGPALARGDADALLRHPLLAAAVDRALADRSPQSADIVLPVPVTREIAAQVIPLDPPLADGGVLLVVLGDRTRERAVERMRADFVANASHELRTPLASLIGFIETLRGPARDDPAAQARFLGIMAEQSERMHRLVDDLLSLSRIEMTEHQAPKGEADLVAVAQAEIDALAPLLARRGVSVERTLPPTAMVAPADPEQLAQVVRNLLDNAIRHGREKGRVRIGIAPGSPPAMRAPPQPGCTLTVSDDGPGIPRADIPRLTERFYRVDRGRSRAAGGTGLGLAIVKHIVNRHRGRLLIESEPGAGASFQVWLPATGEAPIDGSASGPTSAA